MPFLFYLKLYLLTIPVFFAIDLVWLGVVAKSFYRDRIGHLMADEVNWMAALIFYMMYIAGILFFAVQPALTENSWQKAAIYGAALGFLTYATYDFTNWATLKNWSPTVVFVDILWGTFLVATVSVVSYFIGVWLKG
jgi:uncharacterized membrane protein